MVEQLASAVAERLDVGADDRDQERVERGEVPVEGARPDARTLSDACGPSSAKATLAARSTRSRLSRASARMRRDGPPASSVPPALLRAAGELADGAVTWMTGQRTLANHIVPSVTRAAEAAGRARPRVVAGLLVCVTMDEAGVRDRVAERFALAGRVPEYRATLDREGVGGPQDVAVVGDEDAVAGQVHRLAEAGVTDFLAAPFGDVGEQDRTLGVLAALA